MPGGGAAGGCGWPASRAAVRVVAWLMVVLSAPSRVPMSVAGQVEVLAQAQGEDVVGEVELAVGPAAGALGPLAGASLPQVAALLAAGAERDLQRGGQGGQARGVQAGQRGMVQQVAAAPAGTGWFRCWLAGRAGERAGRCSSTRRGTGGVLRGAPRCL